MAPVRVHIFQFLQFAVLFYILGVLHCQDHLFTTLSSLHKPVSIDLSSEVNLEHCFCSFPYILFIAYWISFLMVSESRSIVSDSLQLHGLYSPWNFPGQNTGMGNLSLLQGIFPTQGSNSGLPHGRQILYQLSHKGSPRILEWVAYPFSSGSSQPRNQTRISCIADGFITN